MRRLLLAVCLLLVLPGTAAAGAADDGALTVRLADGTRLVVEPEPFRLRVVGAAGADDVATVAGIEGAPVRVPGLDGPQPVEPLGAAGAFPAVGFVVGADPEVSYPLPLYTGNRLFGAEVGVVVGLVEVVGVAERPDGVDLEVRTDAPAAGPATVRVRRLPGGGARVHVEPPDGVEPVSSVVSLASPEGEGLYGLGARKDSFDQRGLLRNVWTEQQNAGDERAEPLTCAGPSGTTGCDYTFPNGAQAAYFVQPSLHGSRGWTAWTPQTELSRLDLAASRGDVVRWAVAAPSLDLRLAGGGLERSAAAHTADVGRAPAPPAWVYEPWVDVINEGEGEAAPNGGGFSGGQRVRDDLLAVVEGSRRKGIPVGVLGVEGWHVVPDGERLFADLRAQGYRLSAYWNPFHSPGNPSFDEAASRDLFIEDPTGQPYPFVNNRGALTYAIDWTKDGAQQWWDEQLTRSMSLGFEGWMHDFGEFVTEGMRFADGTPPETMHNRYPVLMHEAARTAADRYAAASPGFEPFFYVRSGFDGVQRSTGSVFPGDETTDWAQSSGLPSVVPAMLNLAMGGMPTFTTDVGGYFDFVAPRTTPELLARWGQLAALTPVMRVHNSTQKTSLYPHDLEGDELDAYRRYSLLKQRLAPLVDRLTREGERTGAIGPVRPLVLDDPAAVSVDDQWLLGADLLVAPVLEPGATTRSVHLPAGSSWQPVRVADDGALVGAGAPLDGGQRVEVPVTIADIPLFTRLPADAAAGGAPGQADSTLPATGGAPVVLAAALLLAGAVGRAVSHPR
ncbi:MAG TPA: TIM-barrel domain-containing protein [Mycobacteriales bacterium]|nr:TIM-barrel domain-containing protein [Mycobacteriales bacterium]